MSGSAGAKYEAYRSRAATRYYLDYFQIEPHESELLWVIDSVLQQTLPIGWGSSDDID